jgi:phosphate transport system protein
MQSHFEKELSDLKNKLLTMGSHAETSVRRAVEALMTRDDQLVNRVREAEDIIDHLEVEIDDLGVHLLAKAPLATNLRLITVAMKISQNLERVGDEASKIAKRTSDLVQEAPLKQVAQIPRLAEMALAMLKAALDAFVNNDPAAARALILRDKEVDALNQEIYRELASQMVESPETISRALNLIVVAKSLERIGDHAKNVAEEVVYLCEALDIRHTAATRSSSAE